MSRLILCFFNEDQGHDGRDIIFYAQGQHGFDGVVCVAFSEALGMRAWVGMHA